MKYRYVVCNKCGDEGSGDVRPGEPCGRDLGGPLRKVTYCTGTYGGWQEYEVQAWPKKEESCS